MMSPGRRPADWAGLPGETEATSAPVGRFSNWAPRQAGALWTLAGLEWFIEVIAYAPPATTSTASRQSAATRGALDRRRAARRARKRATAAASRATRDGPFGAACAGSGVAGSSG